MPHLFIFKALSHINVFQEPRSAKFVHLFLVKKSLTTYNAAFELTGVALFQLRSRNSIVTTRASKHKNEQKEYHAEQSHSFVKPESTQD